MAESDRYICIHGHFYQPPRENPWLEAIERQESAGSFHDWNERITAECYGPNAAAPMLDEAGRVTAIRNNYASISYNFGPTLLSWLEAQAPEIYAQVLAADQASMRRFGGHGSAIAQAYNHMIMPLANTRDKLTQLVWGIYDFEHRYGRKPEGLWLPETAVDTESLELMAELGIKFTILEPGQAAKVRRIGDKAWTGLKESGADPTMPYNAVLPSGRKLAIFFYDGPIARAVAFERLLDQGEFLTNRLMGAFDAKRPWTQLVHIATDGETFGHHHRFGEMALAYALDYVERTKLAHVTIYGEFLERFPPTHEAVVKEETSWSCMHGIERWRSDCGCSSGANSGWNQQWRAPLREAFNWLRDRLAPLFEETMRGLLRDPWAARNGYISVVLDRSEANQEKFFAAQATRTLTSAERVRVLQALEIQRNAMLMFTSCGWFFDDLSGIETVQCMQYALRAMQMAKTMTGNDYEEGFLQHIEPAQSNDPVIGNGRQVWAKLVRPAMLTFAGVAAHYGISSLFETYGTHADIYCYHADRLNEAAFEIGRTRLKIGQVRVASKLTGGQAVMTYGVVHLGEHNLHAGVSEDPDSEIFLALSSNGARVFRGGELPEIIRLLDRFFPKETFSLRSLFKDELRRILDLVLSSTLTNAETVYRQLYEEYAPLMYYLREMGMPLPAALRTAAEFAINSHLRRAIGEPRLNIDQIQLLLKEATGAHLSLDMNSLEATLRHHLDAVAQRIWNARGDYFVLKRLDAMLGLAKLLPFEVTLWRVRMIYSLLLRDYLESGAPPAFSSMPSEGTPEAAAAAWCADLLSIGEKLDIRVSAKALPKTEGGAGA